MNSDSMPEPGAQLAGDGSRTRRAAWGPWASTGWTLLLILTWAVGQTIVGAGFVLYAVATGGDVDAMAASLETSGLYLAVASIIANSVCAVALCGLVLARRWTLTEYLAVRLPPWRLTLATFVAITLFIAASDTLTYLLGRPIVPEVMVVMYETAGWVPLFLVALFVAAPLYEEILFRGFLFRGLASGRLGPAGAIVLTSFMWTALHLQYDLFVLGILFVGGLVLGVIRHLTASAGVTILLHVWMNIVATTELVVLHERAAFYG